MQLWCRFYHGNIVLSLDGPQLCHFAVHLTSLVLSFLNCKISSLNCTPETEISSFVNVPQLSQKVCFSLEPFVIIGTFSYCPNLGILEFMREFAFIFWQLPRRGKKYYAARPTEVKSLIHSFKEWSFVEWSMGTSVQLTGEVVKQFEYMRIWRKWFPRGKRQYEENSVAGNGPEHRSIHEKSGASDGRGSWEVGVIPDRRDVQMLDWSISVYSGDFRLCNEVKENILLLLLYLYCLTHSRHPINIGCLNEIINLRFLRKGMKWWDMSFKGILLVSHVTTKRASLISFK